MKNRTDALNDSIIELQTKKNDQLDAVNKQLYSTYESLKPINLLKSFLSKVYHSAELKTDMIGMIAGIISKKLVLGSSKSTSRELLGSILQLATQKVVSKYRKDKEYNSKPDDE